MGEKEGSFPALFSLRRKLLADLLEAGAHDANRSPICAGTPGERRARDQRQGTVRIDFISIHAGWCTAPINGDCRIKERSTCVDGDLAGSGRAHCSRLSGGCDSARSCIKCKGSYHSVRGIRNKNKRAKRIEYHGRWRGHTGGRNGRSRGCQGSIRSGEAVLNLRKGDGLKRLS